MKYIRFIPLLLILLVSCEPYPVPYFIIDVQDVYSGIPPGAVLYDFAIRYEFSCEDPIQYINITVVRTDGITGELVVYDSPEPIRAPRNGTIWFNRGSDTPFILLVTGEYRVDAVLMSDRYGTPQEINSLRASDSFSIMP